MTAAWRARLLTIGVLACAPLVHCAPASARPSGGSRVNACFSQLDENELHVLLPGERCTPDQTELSWDKRGPRGERGVRGERGPRGHRGRRGPPGKSGDSGESRVEKKIEQITKIAVLGLSALVAAVLGTYLLSLLLLNLLARTPGVRNLPIIRRGRRPSLTIEMLDDSALATRLGPAMTGLLRRQIGAYRDRFGLELVTGQQAVITALQSFEDLSGSSAKTALALINYLHGTLPRRRFTLSGELQPRGDKGVGITLALRREDGYDSLEALWSRSLWVNGYGVDAYQRLTLPAASWVDHRLAGPLGGKLLTRDAMSWACFRAGIERHRVGDTGQARSLYELALGHDGRNIGALADLGTLERREGNYPRARELLQEADELLLRAERRHRRCNLLRRQREAVRRRAREARARLWPLLCLGVDEPMPTPDRYRISYQLAALRLNEASESRDGRERRDAKPRPQAAKAVAEARAAAAMIAGRLERFGRTDNQFTQLLQSTIEPAAMVLLANALLERDGSRKPSTHALLPSHKALAELLRGSAELDADMLVRVVDEKTDLAPHVHYNLACYAARRAALTGDDPADDEKDVEGWLETAVAHLETAVHRTPRAERRALLNVIAKTAVLKSVRNRSNLLADGAPE